MLLEITFVAALVVLNGMFAMAELAVVSARRSRLKLLADQRVRGAATALRLADDPGRFLSTVQIGITLVGVLSGAFSGITLGPRLATALEGVGVPAAAAEPAGVAAVVVVITYLSLIIGELVPKQMALRNPERVAARVAPTMALLARMARPAVWVLDGSGKLVLRLLGQPQPSPTPVSDEEVKTLVSEAEGAGVMASDERAMITSVMRLADRSAREIMTPRLEVEVLDLADPPEVTVRQARSSRHQRLPVREGGPDDIIGVVHVNALLTHLDGGLGLDVRAHIDEAPIVLDTAGALLVIRRLREATTHLSLVFDEYGRFEGVITPLDVLEAITGGFHDVDDEPDIVGRPDGSLLVAGWMAADEFAERLGLALDTHRDYATAAGFLIRHLGHLPVLGEAVAVGGWRLEVVDLDGRRIDKILATPRRPKPRRGAGSGGE